MAINKLTDLAFRNFKPTNKVQMISDGGGLVVRVRPLSEGGSISFMLSYRIDNFQRRITLKAQSLKEAREERDYCKRLVSQGKDPSIERSLKLARDRQQQLEEQEALAKINARVTVNDLFNRWLDIDLLDRKDRHEIIRMFNKDVLPVLGNLFVEDVRKGHIGLIVDALKIRGAKHLARNLLKLIRQMFRFAVTRDVVEFDPTASLNITKVTTAPTERERVLTESEIRALFRQLPDAHLMISTKCATLIALSTLCRIGELSKAKFSDVDFESRTWTIPVVNSKNGKPHRIYLSDFALTQFRILKDVAKNETWIFPNRGNSGHVSEKSITKQIKDRQSTNILSNRSKHNQALILTGGKWTPHDLRRSGATLMGDLKVISVVIEKCLNHTEENKVKRVYQRQELKQEQAEAWRLLGERLELLVSLDETNVVC